MAVSILITPGEDRRRGRTFGSGADGASGSRPANGDARRSGEGKREHSTRRMG